MQGFHEVRCLLRSNWWNNKNLPLLLVTESLPKGAAAGPCPLPPAWSLTCSRDRKRCSLFLTCDIDGSHVKLLKKEDYFLLFRKSPRYLVPARYVPQVSQRMSMLGLLFSGLLYFVDQPYFCLVSGRQVQLHSHFGLALHSSCHVFWCALWELLVLPMPKMLFFMSTFPANS